MIDWTKISLKDFAGYVSEELRKRGVETILVGGACVSIYSNNRYQSYDLDYITYEDMSLIKKILNELGFIKKQKYFTHKDCPWFIDFVSPPAAVGEEFVQNFNAVQTCMGTIKLLFPVDCVKDRLAGYYHWDDKEGLNQAINICLEQKIDLSEIKRWSKKENHLDKFAVFLNQLENLKGRMD